MLPSWLNVTMNCLNSAFKRYFPKIHISLTRFSLILFVVKPSPRKKILFIILLHHNIVEIVKFFESTTVLGQPESCRTVAGQLPDSLLLLCQAAAAAAAPTATDI